MRKIGVDMIWQQGRYTASDDNERLDIDTIHQFLTKEAYWAKGRSRDTVEKSIRHSAICFGIYDEQNNQVAFARVVSDFAVFAYLCDVFVLSDHRGQGLGKWLIELVVNHPDLHNLKHITLFTRDAQNLYKQYGFEHLEDPTRFMDRESS